MERQVKTDKWVPDEWLQPDARPREDDLQWECKSTKQQETRCWSRTVFVLEGMRPIDIIRAYPVKIPFPPFHAGHMGVNKHDVECIASAMADPNLRWRKMCHFTVAAFETPAPDLPEGGMDKLGFNPSDYAVGQVLISGHHRFLAFLLCGIPPSELPPVQIRTAPIAVPYMFPWSIVQWGA
jgi:hypothetical protein